MGSLRPRVQDGRDLKRSTNQDTEHPGSLVMDLSTCTFLLAICLQSTLHQSPSLPPVNSPFETLCYVEPSSPHHGRLNRSLLVRQSGRNRHHHRTSPPNMHQWPRRRHSLSWGYGHAKSRGMEAAVRAKRVPLKASASSGEMTHPMELPSHGGIWISRRWCLSMRFAVLRDKDSI